VTGHPHAGPTVAGLALRYLARYPDRIAFVDEAGMHTSYAGAADRVGRYQRVFLDHGLRRGATIALLSANRADAWCAGIAAQGLGMAVTWLHPLGSLDDQRYQLDTSEADAVVVDSDNHYARGGELGATFTLGQADYGVSLAAAADSIGCSAPRDIAQVDDVALISFTGGTTGRAKAVTRRHHQALASTHAILTDFELPCCPRYLAVAPNSHVGGSLLLPTLARGGSIHLRTRFDPGMVLDAIAHQRINMTMLVPTMIYAILDDSSLKSANTSALELLLYGAAPIAPRQLQAGLDRFGPVFAQLYGQTECYPISYLSRADHADPALQSSCGLPTAMTDVRLIDDAGKDVEPGEPGEIAVRSPAAMDQFIGEGEPRVDGWLRTGDIARRDDRGYLHMADRKKDLIISGGFNVYPRDVENALTEHRDVAAAAVFGIPDDRWGEAVTAAVVLRGGATADADTLIAHVRERKGAVHAPKRIAVMDALPRTPVGKIDKTALRARMQSANRS
jgi:fatty-acyl-CoA synthase